MNISRKRALCFGEGVHQAVVDPESCEGDSSSVRLALSYLVFVVGKDEVEPATVDIEGVARERRCKQVQINANCVSVSYS
mgnify:CR=1 FL=1